MNARPVRAGIALLFSVVLILAGLLPVLYLAGVFAWQVAASMQAGSWIALPVLTLFSAHPYAFVPDLSWMWQPGADTARPILAILGKLHFALIPALIGAPFVVIGTLRVLRYRAARRAHVQQHEDRLRRVDDYRRDDSASDPFDDRREPFISSLPVTREPRRAGAQG